MKTAISLPDELFHEVEQLAESSNKSRSEIYRNALEDYVAKHDADRIRDTLNEAVAKAGQESGEFLTAAGRAILEKVEW